MAVQEREKANLSSNEFHPDIERIYHEWDAALSKNDVSALLALYAPTRNSRVRSFRIC